MRRRRRTIWCLAALTPLCTAAEAERMTFDGVADADSPSRSDAGAHLLHGKDGPDFDAAEFGPGKFRGDAHRLFEALRFDHVEAAEHLLGLGERAVDDGELSRPLAQRP